MAPNQTFSPSSGFQVGIPWYTIISLAVSGQGNDTIWCNDWANWIWGQNGNDSIWGLGGNDQILGENGNDYIDGGNDQDSIYGGNGSDRLLGGNGNDLIFGDSGQDAIYGGDGNDRIWAGYNESYALEWLYGGRGQDVFIFQDQSSYTRGNWSNWTDATPQFVKDFEYVGGGPGTYGDVIDLSNIDAVKIATFMTPTTGIVEGTNDTFAWRGYLGTTYGGGINTLTTARNSVGLYEDRSSGSTLVVMDTNGDMVVDYFVQIDDGVSITANMYSRWDFVL